MTRGTVAALINLPRGLSQLERTLLLPTGEISHLRGNLDKTEFNFPLDQLSDVSRHDG